MISKFRLNSVDPDPAGTCVPTPTLSIQTQPLSFLQPVAIPTYLYLPTSTYTPSSTPYLYPPP